MTKESMFKNIRKAAIVFCAAAMCVSGSAVSASAAEDSDADTAAINLSTAETKDMKIGGTVNDSLAFGKNRIKYKFVLNKSGRFKFDTIVYSEKIHWRIVDSSDQDVTGSAVGNEFAYNSDLGFGKSSESMDLTAGTYYLEIYSLSIDFTSTAKYTFTSAFEDAKANEKEPNNDYQQAQLLGAEGTVNGQLAVNDTVDSFKIKVARKTKLNLKLTGTSLQSCKLSVYDKDASDVFSEYLNPFLNSASASGEYSVELDPGMYYISVTTDLYNSTGAYKLYYSIKQTLGSSDVALSTEKKTYDGKTVTPKVTVTDDYGNKLTEGTDYTVEVPSGRTNAGTYTYKITFKGNYKGTAQKKLTITPAARGAKSVTLSSTKAVYNGKVKNPSITVKDGSRKTLVRGTDYTVTVPKGRKNVGKYTYKITFKGNYKGTADKTFTIVPAKTQITKLAKSKSGVKVVWKKSGNATGYIVYRSVNGGSYKRVKTVTSANVRTYMDKSATVKGRRYSYKVIVYKKANGTNYKSASSAAKTVKR